MNRHTHLREAFTDLHPTIAYVLVLSAIADVLATYLALEHAQPHTFDLVYQTESIRFGAILELGVGEANPLMAPILHHYGYLAAFGIRLAAIGVIAGLAVVSSDPRGNWYYGGLLAAGLWTLVAGVNALPVIL